VVRWRSLVDFTKLLGKQKLTRPTDPIEIFDNLDKESGKEYPRPAQKAVLEDWYSKFRDQKDIIVKLHTGQGKTLIGLLILQSRINEGQGPALYVCPNNYLVSQTAEQARAFGIKTVQFVDSKPPPVFLNSGAILITNCSKVFNGKSVFGVLGSQREPVHVGTIVIDDAHKCLDIIRASFSVIVRREKPDGSKNPIYAELWHLFAESLKRQAPGTCSDIEGGAECLTAVPFWTWFDKREEVLAVLSKYKESEEILFVWNLLKDRLDQTMCIFSGTRLEITPRLLPVDMVPSFSQAKMRIFLSATLNEDAFLVRDMGITPESVTNPLSSGDVKYSGERLILMPSLVDPTLRRDEIISWISNLAAKHGEFGVVAITPSFPHAAHWKDAGAEIARVQELYDSIEALKTKVKRRAAKQVLVLVNEYDGVDLPDSTCRILCLDSLPSYNNLMDRYLQEMRPGSGIIRRQIAQRVEQGMGRAIRGTSDWCIVVMAATNLTDFLSENSKRAFLSNEARLQIKIGEELANELRAEGGQLTVMEKLANQCLKRDDGWKEYYKNKMSELEVDEPRKAHLERGLQERKAEILYQQGNYAKAVDTLQSLINSADQADIGWFLQLIASYLYPIDRTRSMNTQLRAHTENLRLFRPETGITYSKLTSTGTRASKIIDWVKTHDSYNALIIGLASNNDKLTFASPSDSFEEAIDELGRALGLSTQRPEKTTGKGPDNLWLMHGEKYWLIECKNGVSITRTEISKTETGQLSNTIGWFKENYEGAKAFPILIHPAKALAKDAYVTEPFWVLNEDKLRKLKDNTLSFYNSLKSTQYDDLSVDIIRKKLKEHSLDTDDLIKYAEHFETRKAGKH
jgi:tetratricopeptide (TPR) repeat protein